MSQLDDFSAVVEGLYRSTLDPAAWPDAMARLVCYVDGSATVYLSSDPCTGLLVRSEVTGIDPVANQLYLEHFADKEVRIPGTLRADVGDVVTEQDMVDPRAFRKSEIYNELLKPFDIPYVMTVCTQRSAVQSSNFVVERSLRQGPFEREQIERLRRLVPHVRLALQLRDTYDEVSAGVDEMANWLQEQKYALIALDVSARVLRLSPLAESLVRQGRFIAVRQERLVAQRPSENAALAAAIRDASLHLSGCVSRGARVKLTCDTRTAVADVLAIHDPRTPPERMAAMVILRSSELTAPTSSEIGTSLGVTPAEARLVYELFERGILDEAARALRISIHTARTQLHSVFAKTDCHTQVQLMRRIASMSTGAF